MFGGKKTKAAVSASRFCQSPLELPYAQLYRYDHFVVAVSKVTTLQGWPLGSAGVNEPTAYGLLDGSHTFPDHGAEEPMLPVEVTFGPSNRDTEGSGWAAFNRKTDDGTYFLVVHINDPNGTIFAALGLAMERAIISGHQFKHIRCIKKRDHIKPPRTDYAEQRKEDLAFLKKVDAGEAELGEITFDRIIFTDEMTTKAPTWSWGWHDWEFEQPRFQSNATAKWRREWLPHRLKS